MWQQLSQKIGRLIEFNFTKIIFILLNQEIVRCGHSLKAVVDTHWKYFYI